MDSDMILKRAEITRRWLNEQRVVDGKTVTADFLAGAAFMDDMYAGIICALEAAEEKEAEDEMRREVLEEIREEFD